MDCRFRAFIKKTLATGVLLSVLRNVSEVTFQKYFWKLTVKHLLQSSLLHKVPQHHCISTPTTPTPGNFIKFLKNFKKKLFFKIPLPPVISEKLFTRKMFWMCVFCVKWISYKRRLLAEKVKSFLPFVIRKLHFRESYGKRRRKTGFLKMALLTRFLELLAISSCLFM